MGIIRNASNRLIRGRVGDTTYYVSLERQIARQALNSSNYGESARRSEAQQSRRVKWSNLVNFYKLSKGWMPMAFESKKKGQSDYNRFMSINLNTSRVALTRDEALQGAVVVEPFVITQGSIPSVDITKSGSVWRTSIKLGNLAITEATTNAQFTAAVTANNMGIRKGMQLSFVSYQQLTTSAGIPQCTCGFYEITLSDTDATPVRVYLPDFCSQVVNGNLGTSDNISVGCFAYILSEVVAGQIRVSSQSLINNNAANITAYASVQQLERAINSYGVDGEVVLSPISLNKQEPIEQPLSIIKYVNNYGPTTYIAGDVSKTAGEMFYEDGGKLYLSGAADLEYIGAYITLYGSDVELQILPAKVTKSGNVVTFMQGCIQSGAELSNKVKSIMVTLGGGSQLEIPFAEFEIHE